MLKRHKHLISTFAKKRLCDAFLLSCLNYCPSIWHYCSKKNINKVEWINESCLRFIFNDFHSSYDKLLDNIDNWPSLHNHGIHDMLTPVYKSFIVWPLVILTSYYNLRGKHSLSIPRVQSTKYGLHSFRYSASKYWNMLPEVLRTSESLHVLKSKIKSISFDNKCGSFFN